MIAYLFFGAAIQLLIFHLASKKPLWIYILFGIQLLLYFLFLPLLLVPSQQKCGLPAMGVWASCWFMGIACLGTHLAYFGYRYWRKRG